MYPPPRKARWNPEKRVTVFAFLDKNKHAFTLMSKLESTRLLLQSKDGKLYRLCRIADADDKKYGEPFFKLMFPGFDEKTTLTKGVGHREIDGEITSNDRTEPSVQCDGVEITYHYFAGKRHLKTRSGDRPSKHYNFPDLRKTTKPVQICSVTLANFAVCELVKTHTGNDIVLQNFHIPSCIGFYLTYRNGPDEPFMFIERMDGKSHQLVSKIDDRAALTVTELPYTGTMNPLTGTTLFLNEDPYQWQKGASKFSHLLYKLKKWLAKRFP